MAYRLGVDLGTTFTAAATVDLRGGQPPAMLGLGNRALQIPSVLFLQEDGQFLIGEAAERRGYVEPSRVVREFKRRIGDPVPVREASSTLGRPDVKLVDTARAARAGLIVMGAFGRNRINEYFLGSNAAAVTRSSPVAVLLAR